MSNSSPIGIFDSGFGGLTVMREVCALLPHEEIVYFGDTAHIPYGTKSGETILRYSLENAAFLLDQGIKVLVIACHTACCFALETLQQTCPIPVLGVIAPSIEQATQTLSGKIGVLGTRATITSGTYQTLLQKAIPHAEVTAIPCPLFVNLVEEGYLDHPLATMAVQEYLRPFKNTAIDALLLGCTHFPLLAHQIRKECGDSLTLIDPGIACALALKKLLTEQGLSNESGQLPHHRFYVSDDPEKFRSLGKTFLGLDIEDVKLIKTLV